MMDAVQHRQVVWLFLWMLIGMGFEMLSLGLVIPAVSILMGAESDLPSGIFAIAWLQGMSYSELVLMGMAALLTAYLSKMVFLLFLAWKQVNFVFGIQQSISQRLFATYLFQPYAFHLNRNSSELIRNTVNDVNVLVHTGLKSGLTMLTELLVLIGLMALMLYVEPTGALLVMFVLGVSGIGFNHLTRKNIQFWGRERQHHEGLRIKHLQQGLGGVKDVILLGKEGKFLDRYAHHNETSARVSRHQSFVTQVPRLFFELLAILGLVVLVVSMVLQGKTSTEILPVLGLFAAASFRLMPSMTRIIGAIQNLRFSVPVIDELSGELSLAGRAPAFERVELLPLTKMIKLDEISFTYPGGEKRVLQDVSLNIPAGAFVGFIGKSGEGKSTLIDLILGLLEPESGHVYVDGVDIRSNIRGWQNQIGYVPQSIFLMDDTLRNNIALGEQKDEIQEERVLSVIRSAQLESFIDLLPDGLDTVVGERGVRLSGGQRQRIGIARALYHNPSVIVLDEATSSLDPQTEADFMEAIGILRKENSQRTVLVITHRLSTVEQCSQIYRIMDGNISIDRRQGDVRQ